MTQNCMTVNCAENIEILRNYLSNLDEFSKDWQMQFNVDKCIVMYMGRKNKEHEYKLANKKIT